LRQNKSGFDAAGAQIMLVGMGSVEETADFRRKFDLPFPMVSDPQRRLYHAFHLEMMSMTSVFSPHMVMRTASALTRGHGVGLPHGDVRQLSAVFIIDQGGTILHRHLGKDPSDHPRPEEILGYLS